MTQHTTPTTEHERILRLVESMRKTQKAYFKDRRPSVLSEAKRLEREVDNEIRDHFKPGNKQATLDGIF